MSEKEKGGAFFRLYQKKLRRYKIFRSISFLWKQYHLDAQASGRKRIRPGWKRVAVPKESLQKMTIAVVCDEMTWKTLEGSCQLVYLTPSNWAQMMEQHHPDLFLCESAWEGLKRFGNCWEARIARNPDIWPENRRVLLRILQYCREAEIPTLYWNKEDPQCDSKYNNFTQTALLFDHVSTTARESIEKYKKLGHTSVHLLPFGFSPRLFYPLEEEGRGNTAAFFGSWYATFPERCENMEMLLDSILKKGIGLAIYDRNYGTSDPTRFYPEKYRAYIRPAIPYENIREELRKYRYVVNLNTETKSETMFARRVYEFMACGRLIISNESVGMRKNFPDTIWYIEDEFDLERERDCVRQNQEYAMGHATMDKRFTMLLQELKLL